jgi:hypothetical protein
MALIEFQDGVTKGNAETFNNNFNELNNNIGDLSTLKTTDKTSCVGAINEINDTNILEICLTKNQNVLTDVSTKVAFDSICYQKGDKLTFTDNGIKIGKGVNTVRVDLKLWLENNTNTSYAAFYIFKNLKELTYNLQPYIANSTNWQTANSYVYVNVQEGDMIYANVRFSAASGSGDANKIAAYNHGSTLAVQVID